MADVAGIRFGVGEKNVSRIGSGGLQRNVVQPIAVEIADYGPDLLQRPLKTELLRLEHLGEVAGNALCVGDRETGWHARTTCNVQQVGASVAVEVAREDFVFP